MRAGEPRGLVVFAGGPSKRVPHQHKKAMLELLINSSTYLVFIVAQSTLIDDLIWPHLLTQKADTFTSQSHVSYPCPSSIVTLFFVSRFQIQIPVYIMSLNLLIQ